MGVVSQVVGHRLCSSYQSFHVLTWCSPKNKNDQPSNSEAGELKVSSPRIMFLALFPMSLDLELPPQRRWGTHLQKANGIRGILLSNTIVSSETVSTPCKATYSDDFESQFHSQRNSWSYKTACCSGFRLL